MRAFNWPLIMSRDASLSESGCQFLQFGPLCCPTKFRAFYFVVIQSLRATITLQV